MRSQKWAQGEECPVSRYLACDARHPSRLERFIGFHQRKDWWKPLRQHGFTRPGRAFHQYVMPTGSCSLQRPFRMFLSVQIAIIVFFCRTSSEEITTSVPRRLDHRENLSEGNGFGKRV